MNRKLILCHSIALDFYLEGSDKVCSTDFLLLLSLHFAHWEYEYTPVTAYRSSSKEGRPCLPAKENVCGNCKEDSRVTGSSPKQDLMKHENIVHEKSEKHLLLITQHRHSLP